MLLFVNLILSDLMVQFSFVYKIQLQYLLSVNLIQYVQSVGQLCVFISDPVCVVMPQSAHNHYCYFMFVTSVVSFINYITLKIVHK